MSIQDFNLITDRTAGDVLRFISLRDKGFENMTEAERTEWNSAQLKGAYNPPHDMNRVGAALNYVRDRLAVNGYMAPDAFEARTDWTADEIPTAAQFAEYIRCVVAVREAVGQLPTTPPAPTHPDSLDHTEANNIEQILLDIDKIVDNMSVIYFYCGELYTGEWRANND